MGVSMNRETKIGLTVILSLLGILAAVLVHRLTRHSESAELAAAEERGGEKEREKEKDKDAPRVLGEVIEKEKMHRWTSSKPALLEPASPSATEKHRWPDLAMKEHSASGDDVQPSAPAVVQPASGIGDAPASDREERHRDRADHGMGPAVGSVANDPPAIRCEQPSAAEGPQRGAGVPGFGPGPNRLRQEFPAPPGAVAIAPPMGSTMVPPPASPGAFPIAPPGASPFPQNPQFAYPQHVENAPREDGTYEVQPSDSYWTISEKLYGSGAYFRALAEHNRSKVARADRLAPGLTISTPPVAQLEQSFPDLCPKPARRETVRNRAAATATMASYHGTGRGYVVQEGDTLFTIARNELGKASRWAEIYELNRESLGKDFNYLTPGMQLAMPAKEGRDATDRTARRTDAAYPR